MLRGEDLTVTFGAHRALDGVDIDVGDGSVVSVLGPSGSGKSTLLRVVAGLTPPDRGTVYWDDEDITSVPTHRRGFGLMFQDYALFPHLDVAGNVGFGLRMHGVGKPATSAAVDAALARVGLADYGDRKVATLSGGEAQRVALARALAPEPKLLMFDEPLGALDATLRETLLTDLSQLLTSLGTTALYVTHDQAEAFAVGSRVVVLRDGQVAQAGPPEDIWRRPRSEFVARFLGLTNIVDATIEHGTAETIWGVIPVGHRSASGQRQLVLRPDALRVSEEGGAIEATVSAVTFRGDRFHATLDPTRGPSLQMTSPTRLRPGDQVRLAIDPEGVVVLGESGS